MLSLSNDFARWSKEPDYGICVRTGHGWLALDCDSEDEDIQADIRKTLVQLLGRTPRRGAGAPTATNACTCWRSTVISVSASTVWRVIWGLSSCWPTANNSFACGTHSSGARIEWDGGLPDDPPAITADQLETLWQRLAEHLPVSVTTEAGKHEDARPLNFHARRHG
jgi:hypothetical protein